jgi:hypothetical protein
MSTDFKAPPDQTAAALLSGIVGDLQHLLQQQLQLMRQEAGIAVRQRTGAGLTIGLGAAISLIGGFTLSLALSHLLYWLLTPVGMDPGRLPLWGCYGVIAVLLLVIGGVMTRVGLARFRQVSTSVSTVESSLMEHVEWKKNQPQ